MMQTVAARYRWTQRVIVFSTAPALHSRLRASQHTGATGLGDISASENEVELLFGTFSSKLTFPASAAAEKAKMVYPVPAGGALKIWERGFQYIFYFQQNAAETIGQAPIDVLIHARDKKLIKPDDF